MGGYNGHMKSYKVLCSHRSPYSIIILGLGPVPSALEPSRPSSSSQAFSFSTSFSPLNFLQRVPPVRRLQQHPFFLCPLFHGFAFFSPVPSTSLSLSIPFENLVRAAYLSPRTTRPAVFHRLLSAAFQHNAS